MKLDSKGKILVCGAMAYETIMAFDGRFGGHILPEHARMLNISFRVPDMRREFGGRAGNICYNLALLGLNAQPVATVGQDFTSYRAWLERHNICLENILELRDTFTARTLIITDREANQITAFHPGAMDLSHKVDIRADSDVILGVISPDGHEGMKQHARQLTEQNVPILLDPGQEVSSFRGDELKWLMEHSRWMVLNEDEWQIFTDKTLMRIDVAVEMLDALIITKGAEGSVIHTREQSFRIPPVPAEEPIDPRGCGDAYRAGILYGLVHGHDWPTTGRIASLLASLKISSQGGQNHHFTLEQFHDIFAGQFMVLLG